MVEKKIAKTAIIIVYIFIIAQSVVLYYFFGAKQYSDNSVYMDIAVNCYQEHQWYPMTGNLHDSYFWAPGLINFFIVQLKIFGTLNYNEVFNFVMNIIILLDVYYISKRLFNQRIAYWSIIIFSITYSNIIGIAVNGTEIPFLFTALTAFTICLYRQSFIFLLLASLLFFISNTIRPLVVFFLFTVLLYFIIKKYNWRKFVYLLLPFIFFNTIYGFYNKQKIGEFVYQSTTSGVNLIYTANDYTDGTTSNGYRAVFDSTKNCYIVPILHNYELTFKEKDRILKEMAFEWIKENPVKFAKMYIYKIFYMYADDAWGERLMLNTGFTKGLRDKPLNEKIEAVCIIILKNIIYYITCILCFYALIKKRKEILSEKGILVFLLLIGTAGSCIFAMMPRYHYPFMFVIIIWAAYGIETFLQSRKNKINKNI